MINTFDRKGFSTGIKYKYMKYPPDISKSMNGNDENNAQNGNDGNVEIVGPISPVTNFCLNLVISITDSIRKHKFVILACSLGTCVVLPGGYFVYRWIFE